MTIAILVIVILLLLSDISASSIRREQQAQIAALRIEVRAMHEAQVALHQQLERRFF
jgi:hypothetical protein